MKRNVALVAAAVGIISAVCYWAWPSRAVNAPPELASATAVLPAPVERDEPTVASDNPPPSAAPETVTVATSMPSNAAPPDEQLIMSALRQLGDSAPAYSLQLAREGNRRFPNSPDAAEREWYVCKSLVNLENFYDARAEARVMVQTFPGTEWATDVERHLLVNPLDLPGDPPP